MEKVGITEGKLTGDRSTASDDVLAKAVAAGDDHAFGALYARHAGTLERLASGMVHDRHRAQDLVQEVFLQALERMRSPQGPPVALRPWLLRVARNRCIDELRRIRPLPVAEPSLSADPGTQPDAMEQLHARARLDAVTNAVAELPQQQREALIWREFGGDTADEIGERIGVSRLAVESTLFRARTSVRAEAEASLSGARCAETRDALARIAEGGPPRRREELRVGRHLRSCTACRRHAVALGQVLPAA